jgi:uncharacterized coiled-coil protein SlyX
MATLYLSQVGSALEAELAAKNILIAELQRQIVFLTKQRDLIKEKWEDLTEQLEAVDFHSDELSI